jgi:ATP-dependent DNA ligase
MVCIQLHMPASRKTARVSTAAVPAEALEQSFPEIDLPLQPPYPPAEAKSVKEVPRGAEWLYEPKWDGFRCLAFRSGGEVILQSKAGQPLTRYFPEIVEALRSLGARQFVLDGEIVVPSAGDASHAAALDFDALLQRIHPAASRIQRLARETPAVYMLFDLLVDALLVDANARLLTAQPLSVRRRELEEFAEKFLQQSGGQGSLEHETRIRLSPATADFSAAERWMREGAGSGWDGVVAKRLDCEYASGERTGMVKIKRIRTADCVVGGFRWSRAAAEKSVVEKNRGKAAKKAAPAARKKPGDEVGSLLLGLYNDRGELDHVGFSSSFSREERKKLKSILKPLIAGPPRNSGEEALQDSGGFTGKAPGGPSRWTRDDRDTEWVPLKPELVGEFQYDHFSGGRFRHGTKFLRWCPDKKPRQCVMEQLRPGRPKAA